MNRPLDPRDPENWLELSKRYPHLKEFSKDGVTGWKREFRSENTLFTQEKRDWLKSAEGLITLKNTWLAALYVFAKNEGLAHIDLEGWKKCISIVAITDIVEGKEESCLELDTSGYPGYWKFLFGAGQNESEREQWKAYGRDPENYRVASESTSFMKIRVHIALRAPEEIRNQWRQINGSLKSTLEKDIWKALISTFPELGVDDPTGFYSDISDMYDGFTTEVLTVSSQQELESLIGLDFFSLFKEVLHPRPRIQRTNGEDSSQDHIQAEPRPYIEKGRVTNPIEKSIATLLISSGYLVILEPELYLPHPEANTYRNPDLIVIDKGRAIALEIDDTSHLIDHDNAGRPNIRKWKRDRLLDEMMLRSGIPVLRVWHTEARDRPEQVLTRVIGIFESLGGSRFSYQ